MIVSPNLAVTPDKKVTVNPQSLFSPTFNDEGSAMVLESPKELKVLLKTICII